MANGIATINQFNPGDHACALIDTREQRLALASRFIHLGLRRNRKVIHIHAEQDRDDVVQKLTADGLDVSPWLKNGQLAFSAADEYVASDRRFDPDGIFSGLNREARKSQEEGFGAPWICIEMTWSSIEKPENDLLVKHEVLLNRFFAESECIGLCLYDRRRFPSNVLLEVLSYHPLVFIDAEPCDNPWYIPPADIRSEDLDRALLDRRIEFLKTLKPERTEAEAFRPKHDIADSSRDHMLETMLELIPSPVFYKDRDGFYQGCNTAFAEYLGLPKDRIVGKTVHDVAPREKADVYKRADDAMFVNPGVQRYNAMVRFADGSDRDVLFSKSTWRGADGSPAGLVGVMFDRTERKRAMEQLEEAREGFRHVVNRFHEAVMIVDEDDKIRHVNTAAETMFRIPAKNLVGRKFGLPEGEIVKAESQLVSFGGDMQLAEIYSYKTMWEGKPSNLVLLRDITERRRTEELLKRNEARLTAFYELYRKDFDTEKELIEFALNEAVRFTGSRFGYFHFVNDTQTHIERCAWSDEIREECRIEVASHRPISDTGRWADSIRLKRPVVHNEYPNMVMRRGYPSGHPEILKHMSVPVLVEDRAVAIAGVANKGTPYDDEDARQMKLFMQGMWSILLRRRDADERRRLYTAIDQSPNIVMITDKDGRIQFVNAAFTQITKYPKHEALGQTPRILKSDRHDDVFYRELWDTITEGRVWRGCMVNKTREGDLLDVETVISPVKNKENRIIAYVCDIKDITEEKRKEEQLRHSQKMEAIGQLAGGVAHDFNNMLQVIFGSVEFALDRVEPGSELHEDLDEIHKASERASELTRQLLAFGRRQLLSPVHMNLNDTVSDWLKMLRRVIPENIAIQFISGHRLGAVRADAVQINQVLMNVCINARDAMPRGGQIVIENQNVVFDDAYCRQNLWAKPGRYVLMSISDTGCGIAPEHLPYVFDPFFTTKGVGQGTGMGLAMVYGAITQHNGLVHVYSEVGKGTAVKIYLPVTEQMAGEVGRQIKGPVRGGDETLLVVEDDSQVRKVVKRILQSAGYRVLCAEDGGEAIGILENQGGDVHLALLDVVMPEMGGREVHDRIRKHWPHIRTIFSSGYANNAIHTSFILEDGLILIPKPYNKEDLLRKIREVLDREGKMSDE